MLKAPNSVCCETYAHNILRLSEIGIDGVKAGAAAFGLKEG